MENFFHHCYHKSREIAKNEGVAALVKKGGSGLKTLAYTTNGAIWFCRLLDEILPEIDIPDVRIVIAAESEFEKWLQQHQGAFPWIYVEREVLATRNDPKLAFIAKIDGKIVAYLKVAVNKAYILDYDAQIPLPANAVFIQDTFVLPEFRRKGIASCTISNAMTYLKNQGYCKIFCHVPKWNTASTDTYTGLGFKACGHIRFLRIFKWKIYSTKPEKLIRTAQCN